MDIEYTITSTFHKPVESGYIHQCDAVMQKLIEEDSEGFYKWLDDFVAIGTTGRKGISDTIQILGRMPIKLINDVAYKVAKRALASGDITLRDAAICALELWETHEALEILRGHTDPVEWLNNYVKQILSYGEDNA